MITITMRENVIDNLTTIKLPEPTLEQSNYLREMCGQEISITLIFDRDTPDEIDRVFGIMTYMRYRLFGHIYRWPYHNLLKYRTKSICDLRAIGKSK